MEKRKGNGKEIEQAGDTVRLVKRKWKGGKESINQVATAANRRKE